ncbi:hypothetical protein K491DRAFT_274490 [Lophiostoma macrostomum CBS 122681]|uniref:Uncharacterized protein n=1 Tax=Lophiostoma macrostomum CBS 122681 TaxID=1314788 RepID=A0A6A6TE59_9PLEO|nr:hypothetical protein K491DRAFT_274490 [Lophiostoma macrostomum CBS 122681]
MSISNLRNRQDGSGYFRHVGRVNYAETKRRKRSSVMEDGSILPCESASNINTEVSETVMHVLASTVGTALNTPNYKQDIAGLVNNLTDSLNDRFHQVGVRVKCSDFDEFKKDVCSIVDRLYQAAVTEIAMKETEVNMLRRDAAALKEQYEEQLESLQIEKTEQLESLQAEKTELLDANQNLRSRLQQVEGMNSSVQSETHTLRANIEENERNARRLCAKIEKLRASNSALQQQLDMYCVDSDWIHFPTNDDRCAV